MEKDYDREDAEFEQEKEEGFYQPSKNAEEASTTREKGNMAIGAIGALMGSIVAFIIVGYLLDRFFGNRFGTSPSAGFFWEQSSVFTNLFALAEKITDLYGFKARETLHLERSFDRMFVSQ